MFWPTQTNAKSSMKPYYSMGRTSAQSLVAVAALLVAVRKDLRRPAKRRGDGIIREPKTCHTSMCLPGRRTEVATRLCPPAQSRAVQPLNYKLQQLKIDAL
jgi:hypothetical protein